MKNYGLNKKLLNEKVLYKLVEFKYFILQYISKSENMRDFYKHSYDSYFKSQDNKKSFRQKHENYAVPEGKHCIPVCVVTSDLILRENIDELKKGLVKLLKNNYSHKFLGGFHSIDEILKRIENMDDTLTWWYTSIDVGRFDFESQENLSSYINYFDLYIRPVNSSYLSIETYLYLNEDYLNTLQKTINDDIKTVKTNIMHGFHLNKKKSGGRSALCVGGYSEHTQKSDAIYESITSLKWAYYNELQKFIPTVVHRLKVAPPSILFYQTNIDYENKEALPFWASLGLLDYEGQFIDESQKLFFNISRSGRYEQHSCHDMGYVFHDTKLELIPIYRTLDFQVINTFCEEYAQHFFRFIHLEQLNQIFSRKLVDYKLKLNKIKLKKHQLYNILKLRHKFECDIDKYSRYISDNIWDDSEKHISELFGEQTCKKSLDYRYLTSNLKSTNKIQEQIDVLSSEFENKSSIIKHLAEYKNESKNRRLNFWMFIFAAATLILLIFPEWASDIADFLKETAVVILTFLKENFN